MTLRIYRGEHNKSKSRKKKVVTLNVIKSFACRAEIGSKYFDKLKPEPGPTRSSPKKRPDLWFCTMWKSWASEGGAGGPWPPWILKLLAKKGCFFSISVGKKQISPLLVHPGKYFGKIFYWPSGKNPSDAHSQKFWVILAQRHKNIFKIKSKCITINCKKKVPSFTFNTKRMCNKTGCDVSVKQMFWTWMKTLLHCGFG